MFLFIYLIKNYVAFLGSPNESGFMMSKRAMYEPGSVMVCSQKRACGVVSLCFVAIIAVALIVASTKAGKILWILKVLILVNT